MNDMQPTTTKTADMTGATAVRESWASSLRHPWGIFVTISPLLAFVYLSGELFD